MKTLEDYFQEAYEMGLRVEMKLDNTGVRINLFYDFWIKDQATSQIATGWKGLMPSVLSNIQERWILDPVTLRQCFAQTIQDMKNDSIYQFERKKELANEHK